METIVKFQQPLRVINPLNNLWWGGGDLKMPGEFMNFENYEK
jgi:hypothetical protein